MTPLHNVALSDRTTLGVGGPAQTMFEAVTDKDLIAILGDLTKKNGSFLILGGGSNVVVADTGVAETVIAVKTRGIVRKRIGNRQVEVSAMAGEPWDDFVADCVESGLIGIECLSGIPGLVGATPIQNVGAYGSQVSDCIHHVRCFDREKHQVIELTADQCEFGYRNSIFKGACRHRYVVLSTTFILKEGGTPPMPRYAELSHRLRALGLERPTPNQLRQQVIALRRSKSMVLDSSDPDSRSVGSFFVNPVVSGKALDTITTTARQTGVLGADEQIPAIRLNDQGSATDAAKTTKIPAAWLIERSGFAKGYTRGGAALSRQHALAIVNRNHATAKDVTDLARQIQERVYEMFSVLLAPEPILWGFDRPPLL